MYAYISTPIFWFPQSNQIQLFHSKQKYRCSSWGLSISSLLYRLSQILLMCATFLFPNRNPICKHLLINF